MHDLPALHRETRERVLEGRSGTGLRRDGVGRDAVAAALAHLRSQVIDETALEDPVQPLRERGGIVEPPEPFGCGEDGFLNRVLRGVPVAG